MFGSAARGNGDTDSDIDLFIVRPRHVNDDDSKWRGQLDALAGSVRRWTGNHASIAEVAEADLPRLRQERPPIVQNLRAHALALYGADITELLEVRQ